MLGAFQGFGCDGDDAGAAFAGAFREQLLDPEAEPGNPRRCHQGELVATIFGQSADDGSKPGAGIFTYGPDSDASTLHGFSRIQQPRQIDSHERGGHQAEIGEDGISAADVGIIDEGASETAGFSQPFQGGARVGHGDEVVAGVGRTSSGFPPGVGNERRKPTARWWSQIWTRRGTGCGSDQRMRLLQRPRPGRCYPTCACPGRFRSHGNRSPAGRPPAPGCCRPCPTGRRAGSPPNARHQRIPADHRLWAEGRRAQ